jgi:hypothetical protein
VSIEDSGRPRAVLAAGAQVQNVMLGEVILHYGRKLKAV